jgi:predicted DNA binding CopG/RHH family protein
MGGKYTDAQKRASIKYLQDKTESIQIRAPKGTKEAWKAAAEAAGAPSLQRYIINAVETAIKAGKTEAHNE